MSEYKRRKKGPSFALFLHAQVWWDFQEVDQLSDIFYVFLQFWEKRHAILAASILLCLICLAIMSNNIVPLKSSKNTQKFQFLWLCTPTTKILEHQNFLYQKKPKTFKFSVLLLFTEISFWHPFDGNRIEQYAPQEKITKNRCLSNFRIISELDVQLISLYYNGSSVLFWEEHFVTHLKCFLTGQKSIAMSSLKFCYAHHRSA